MGPEFDPAWEYFVPDPEIAECIGATATGVEAFGIEECRILDRGGNIGVRFGTGNPDVDKTKLGPERPMQVRVRTRRVVRDRATTACKRCNRFFAKNYASQEYCSGPCRPGRPRTLNDLECLVCGAKFRPDDATQKMCSLSCGGVFANRLKPRKIDPQLFAEMWVRGVKATDIAAHFGICITAVKRERRKQGLPARGPRGAPCTT